MPHKTAGRKEKINLAAETLPASHLVALDCPHVPAREDSN